MNNFTKKGFVRKIIIVLIFLTIFNFLHPNIVVQADTIEKQNASLPGGVLLSPVISLVTAIGDGVMSLLHRFILRSAVDFYTYR